MTTTEVILNYAVIQGGVFVRKKLLHDIEGKSIVINKRALDLQLSRMIASGILKRTRRGEYLLTNINLPEFVYQPSDKEKEIFNKLKQQFPFLDFCIWSPKVLSSFMLHIPNIGYTFVDVEKDGMESVFHVLQEMKLGRNILLSPSLKECEFYLTGSDAIVVRQLIGQSPLTMVDGCSVPRIEKILVDVITDNELRFASGSEIYTIYESALERNNVNMSKLLRYASRRNRKEKAERIIITINNDKPQKQIYRMDYGSSRANEDT